ncbi:hypothetical protein [Actinomadura livida]|uniref:Uncharacterized protein n=1 Tax=Actinomadura livida TaxID=79909 RepID=A0A7W7IJ14_9ACTN|nr:MULTISPECIES: hypothetical protein [Actinomadura]MBB4777992.1 hypothetical protein [Actinomadura catellatispora]GGT97378.1 hypothetical protein GCM10010208_20820 [Actinomadura livida]
MSNGARHGLGALVGLVVTPIIAACMMYGTDKLSRAVRTFAFEGGDRWVGAAVFVVAAVLLGLVAGSRLSPLASFIPGAAYTVIGVLWILAPRWTFQHTGRDFLPRELWIGYTTLAAYGVFLLIGLGLVVASLAPSRWKALRPAGAAPRFGAPPAPMGPPMHGAPAHMGPPPGQGSPPWQGAPQYGQPPARQPGPGNPPPLPSAAPAAPPAPPPAPPAPAPAADDRPAPPPRSGADRSDSDEDEPGEWTQVYGGNR